MRARRASGALAVLGLLVLTGCGDAPGFDVHRVEAYLAQDQAHAFGAGIKVGTATCPGHHPLREGMTLRCTLAVGDASVPYRVRLQHVHAAKVKVDVTLDAVVLRGADLASFVRKQLPASFAKAKVDCGDDVLVAQVGQKLSCTVASGAQTETVALLVKDEAGDVTIA
jgi:hypothetical protein